MNHDTLTFDPSLTAVGYAHGGRSGTDTILNDAGITGRMTKGKRSKASDRARTYLIYDDVLTLMRLRQPTVIVIETPALKQHGRLKKRIHGMGRYGMAVGVVVGAAFTYEVEQADRMLGVRIVLTAAGEWSRASKDERQAGVSARFPEYDPSKDSGMDISDAIALLCWWNEKSYLDTVV